MAHDRQESDKIALGPLGEPSAIELANSATTTNASTNASLDSGAKEIQYLKGLRFHFIVAAIALSLFLTNLEIPVVTTALISITNDLGGLERSAWVVSSYLVGYVSFLIIFAKLSDIFGRKLLFLIALFIFTVFSAACGAAQTLTQLIVFRAFQGLGGGGCFSVPTAICLELVPREKYAPLTGFISLVFSSSMIAGPIVGGAITNGTTWRWVFLLNVPATVPVMVAVLLCIPKNFPHHGDPNVPRRTLKTLLSKQNIARVDLLGSAILLIATIALVAALEEAGLNFGWKSAFVIALLCVSVVLWIAFVFWERHVTLSPSVVAEPVFPWRFLTSRVWLGMTINALSLGAVWISGVFQLPQRFQVVHGLSPLAAGVRVMAYTGAAPISSIITAIIAKKGVPPIYLVLGASCLQIVGFALLGSLPASTAISKAQYGYQVIAGFGCGTNISLLTLMTPFSVSPQDNAVAMGAITQFRIMGGAIGLSIVNTAMHGLLRSRLSPILKGAQLDQVLNSAQAIAALPVAMRKEVLLKYSEGYNLQMMILAGLAAGQIIGTLVMWQKKQIKV
ncbi:MFS multidrug transporter-like protein [Pleomassaria siparia CBS 279.74]|uniref:MFS multidrug transporter-like protein n=1 Tax=Pleomassaria siparia CBS 279.74 TaxID=1314801 RepID=A0A6G1K031_9PLEO|nr:MFS multidrug transporter-like protein [Pleomassaria siparia CBS 279.74]